MFSKKIQLEAVEMYLKGVSTGEIRKKFGIKGSATLGIWVESIKRDGIYGFKDLHRQKTKYPYSFKIKVIKWRLDHRASYPVAALHCIQSFNTEVQFLRWHCGSHITESC